MAMQLNNPRTREESVADIDILTDAEEPYSLIVWNDEVNSFDWVIQTLMEVCKHTTEQAEQCAMIIHTQGKYGVKRGSYEELKPMCDAITDLSLIHISEPTRQA